MSKIILKEWWVEEPRSYVQESKRIDISFMKQIRGAIFSKTYIHVTANSSAMDHNLWYITVTYGILR